MKRLLLVLVILVGILIFTGCNCCPTCSPINQSCTLTVTAGDWVWGEVYINGQPTGQYIDYSIPSIETVVLSVPCNQWVDVYIVDSDLCDSCNSQSHMETIFIDPGSNYLYFGYWKNDKNDKQNDFHQRFSTS